MCVLRRHYGGEDASQMEIRRWFHEQRYKHWMEIESWLYEHRAQCPMGCESSIEVRRFPDVNNVLSDLRISCIYASNNCPEVSFSTLEMILRYLILDSYIRFTENT